MIIVGIGLDQAVEAPDHVHVPLADGIDRDLEAKIVEIVTDHRIPGIIITPLIDIHHTETGGGRDHVGADHGQENLVVGRREVEGLDLEKGIDQIRHHPAVQMIAAIRNPTKHTILLPTLLHQTRIPPKKS